MNDTPIIEIRCPNCQKKLCEANKEAVIKAVCSRCKTVFEKKDGDLINK